jgi:hypothetical protein
MAADLGAWLCLQDESGQGSGPAICGSAAPAPVPRSSDRAVVTGAGSAGQASPC